jgi:hypothetical protein
MGWDSETLEMWLPCDSGALFNYLMQEPNQGGDYEARLACVIVANEYIWHLMENMELL